MSLSITFKKMAYELLAIGGHVWGYEKAADLLDHFLDASGTLITVPSTIFQNDSYVITAQNSIRYKLRQKCRSEAGNMKPGKSKTITINETSGLISHPSNKAVWYAFGQFYLKCRATINLTKGTSSTSNVPCNASGTLKWYIEDKYDWHIGWKAKVLGYEIKDKWAKDLVNAGEAKEFNMKTEWTESFSYNFNSNNVAVPCGATCKDFDQYGKCDRKVYSPPCWQHQ